MTQQTLEKMVVGMLRATIVAHGPITPEWIGSAAKRISHQIYGELKVVGEGGHELCTAKMADLQKDLIREKKKNADLAETADYWRKKAKEQPSLNT